MSTCNMNNVRPFGMTSGGEAVSLINLDNGCISCNVLTFGAALQSLFVPDRKGRRLDVVLGYDSLEEYEKQDAYLGATVGRFANRIAKGRFELNGKTYSLAVNNGPNHLHGGIVGFSYRVWDIESCGADFVRLSLVSCDGEENYPGNMKVSVTYSLQGSALHIDYEAVSDADTVCSLTNHSYFNLAGHDSGSVLAQELMLNASCFTPTDADSIPTGEIVPVAGTAMDFGSFTPMGKNIESDFIQLVQGKGYDHNYVVDGQPGTLRAAATARCIESGIVMQADTSMPGLQLYTANYIPEGRGGKGGCAYGPRHGFCLETQFYPDAPNQPGFPSPVLKAGEKYHHKTVFSFSVE